MKQKDMMYLLLAVVILLVAGYVGYTQLMPNRQTGPKVVEVEKIGSIPSGFNEEGLKLLKDPEMVQDFATPVDLTGLGNPLPFGK